MSRRSLLAAALVGAAMLAPLAEAQGLPALPALPASPVPQSPPAAPALPAAPGAPAPAPPPPTSPDEATATAAGAVSTAASSAPLPAVGPLPAIPFPGAEDPLAYAAQLASDPPDAADLAALVALAAAAGGQSVIPATPTSHNGTLEDAMLAVYEALGIALTPEQRALLWDAVQGVEPALQQPVALILFAIADTQAALARQLQNLTAAERQLLAECGLSPEQDPMALGAPACSDPRQAREAALKYLAGGQVLGFELGLLAAVQDALVMLEEVAEGYGVPLLPHWHSQSSATVDHVNIFSDPLKLVEIGSLKTDVYTGNTVGSAFLDPRAKVLTIDLAGDDVYEVRAGAAAPYLPTEKSLEDDELSQHEEAQQSLAFGSLVGVSIDLSGRDHYVGNVGALGAGNLGVGLLLDLGGDDTYEASSGSQGAAYLGLGVLFDAAGNDIYAARYRSQGFGMLGGLGLLVDAAGSDTYAGELLVQGAGSIHGVGLVLDAAGDDSYAATAAGTAASQGASHLVGLGLLVDAAGADRYQAPEGGRGYVYENLEPPWNVGAGVFFDQGGLDIYAGPSPGADDSEWSTLNGGRGWDTSPEHAKNASQRVPPPQSHGGNQRDNGGRAGNGNAGSGGDPGNSGEGGGAPGNANGNGAGGSGNANAGSSSGSGSGAAPEGQDYPPVPPGAATADARLMALQPRAEGHVAAGAANPRTAIPDSLAAALAPAPAGGAADGGGGAPAPGSLEVVRETPVPVGLAALALLLGSRLRRRPRA